MRFGLDLRHLSAADVHAGQNREIALIAIVNHERIARRLGVAGIAQHFQVRQHELAFGEALGLECSFSEIEDELALLGG